MAQITLTKVGKSFGSVNVLRDIDLHVVDGELVVFVGPSGCGKSTLLRVIAGLEKVSEGEIEIDGQCVNDVTAAERGLAMVFQSYALYPHMTVRRNLAFGLENSKMPKAEIAERIAEVARMLEIEPYLERRPGQLSGGQRQRVAIGRAIVRRPVAFLLDEPLSNLDAELRVSTRAELAALHARLSSTMIYVTHDQVEAMTLADRIVVMRAGKIEQVGTPLELYNTPANRFVAGFIGAPHMNFLKGRIIEQKDGALTLSFGDAYRVVLDTANAADVREKEVSVGVRPQHLTLSNNPSDPRITLRLVEALGSETVIHGDINGERLIAVLPGQQPYRAGDELHVDIAAAPLHLFNEQGIRLLSTDGSKEQIAA